MCQQRVPSCNFCRSHEKKSSQFQNTTDTRFLCRYTSMEFLNHQSSVTSHNCNMSHCHLYRSSTCSWFSFPWFDVYLRDRFHQRRLSQMTGYCHWKTPSPLDIGIWSFLRYIHRQRIWIRLIAIGCCLILDCRLEQRRSCMVSVEICCNLSRLLLYCFENLFENRTLFYLNGKNSLYNVKRHRICWHEE